MSTLGLIREETAVEVA